MVQSVGKDGKNPSASIWPSGTPKLKELYPEQKISWDGEWREWFFERAKLSAIEMVPGTEMSFRERARKMTVRFSSFSPPLRRC